MIFNVLWRKWPFCRQWFRKHCLKAEIATEVEAHLPGNVSLVSAETDNRPKHELFGVVAAIRSSWSYVREFIREFNSERQGTHVEAG
jgi:hypothetical protein